MKELAVFLGTVMSPSETRRSRHRDGDEADGFDIVFSEPSTLFEEIKKFNKGVFPKDNFEIETIAKCGDSFFSDEVRSYFIEYGNNANDIKNLKEAIAKKEEYTVSLKRSHKLDKYTCSCGRYKHRGDNRCRNCQKGNFSAIFCGYCRKRMLWHQLGNENTCEPCSLNFFGKHVSNYNNETDLSERGEKEAKKHFSDAKKALSGIDESGIERKLGSVKIEGVEGDGRVCVEVKQLARESGVSWEEADKEDNFFIYASSMAVAKRVVKIIRKEQKDMAT